MGERPIRILETSIVEGQAVPANGTIRIAFDRYLLPSTIVRQSYAVLDGNNQQIGAEQPVALQTIYDPVARTVTIAGPPGGGAWLVPGQPYKLVLTIPEGDSNLGGFRAIDRATLDPNDNRVFAFFAGPAATQAPDPAVDFCGDVLPLLNAKCGTTPTCHASSDQAASGLVLSTYEGVRRTAIGRVAQGSNTAGQSFFEVPATNNPELRVEFGVNMPIIKQGDPGSSWLVYKLELARPPTVDTGPKPKLLCTPPAGQPEAPLPITIPGAPRYASELEREVLSDYVLGREMPYPYDRVGSYLDQALTFEEREKISLWIAKGAQVRECGGCGVIPVEAPADAGANPDAQAGDSGGPADAGADGAPTDASDQ